ncbi:flagellar filament capping protein FliD [Litorivivens sp.]|uniref:flagellar filament capping protein FliD n=1 Tax=Litorivivens sp. TaxID=2020868 RepID=UPI0035670978
MAQITSSGIGSGLDISGLVSQLVQAERTPQETRLNTNEIRAQSRLSAFGGLKSSLSSFQGALTKLQEAGLYQGREASVSDEALFKVSADSDAAVGSYSIQAEKLASRHKLASVAFINDDAAIGTGTLSISVNGKSFSVDIATGSDSLTSVRDAVNSASDNGVTASIIREQNGSRLVFTAAETGAANAITITASVDGSDTGDLTQLNFDPEGLPADNKLLEQQAAADAELTIDGFTAVSPNNVFSSVVDGVTITLLDTNPGVSESLDVNLDTDAVRNAVTQFVNAYNTLRTNLNNLTAYDPETGKAGLLQGDSTTSRLSNQLRQMLNETVSGADADLDTLAEIGITTNFETGRLETDSDKLNGLIASNFDDFAALFSGDNGIAARLDAVADVYTRFEGILDTRTDGLQKQIDRISDQRIMLDKRLAVIEARYLQQFTALDALLGELNQTSSFLTSQLANLPGFTREKK